MSFLSQIYAQITVFPQLCEIGEMELITDIVRDYKDSANVHT